VCCWTTLDGESAFYISLIIKNIFHPERGTTAGANVNSIAFCCPTLPYIGEKLIDAGCKKLTVQPLGCIFFVIWCIRSNLLFHKDSPGGILFMIISIRLSPLLTWLDESATHCAAVSQKHTELWSLQIGCWNKPEARAENREGRNTLDLYPLRLMLKLGIFSQRPESGLSAFPLFVFMFMRVIRVADKTQKTGKQLARSIFRKHKSVAKEKLGQLNPLCVNNWLSI
jgi:hypothetical protein